MCDVLQVTQKPIEELKAEIRRIVKKFSEKSIFMDMALNEKAMKALILILKKNVKISGPILTNAIIKKNLIIKKWHIQI